MNKDYELLADLNWWKTNTTDLDIELTADLNWKK